MDHDHKPVFITFNSVCMLILIYHSRDVAIHR